VEIVWTPSPESDLSGYRIYRGVGDAEVALVGEVEAGTTSFTDAEAGPGVLYRYTVTAVDKAGNESPPSDAAGGRLP
jgi:fibronectin type 3 domain-containing protein